MRANQRLASLASLVMCLALLATTGCTAVRGDLVETGIGPVDTPLAVQADTTAAEEDASEAFNFSATELFSGTEISGADLYQNAPMIVTFVTPTCAVCRSEGPEVAAAAETNGDITYLIVHSGADAQSYEQYADETGLYQENLIHINDLGSALLQRFGVSSYPTSLLVGTDGTVRQSIGALELQGQAEAADVVRGAKA